jgi:hypothetical protein
VLSAKLIGLYAGDLDRSLSKPPVKKKYTEVTEYVDKILARLP